MLYGSGIIIRLAFGWGVDRPEMGSQERGDLRVAPYCMWLPYLYLPFPKQLALASPIQIREAPFPPYGAFLLPTR